MSSPSSIPPSSMARTALIGRTVLTDWSEEDVVEGEGGCVEAGNGCSVSVCVCLHPHVCLIEPAVRVETEVWQRARWVIRLSPCALKVTATVYLHPAAAAAGVWSNTLICTDQLPSSHLNIWRAGGTVNVTQGLWTKRSASSSALCRLSCDAHFSSIWTFQRLKDLSEKSVIKKNQI